MRRTLARRYLPLMLASSLLLSGPEAHAEIRLDLSPFDSLKFKGVYKNGEDVFKVVIPHTDIRVTSGETVLTPELGLKSWAAFKKSGKEAILTGELLLLEGQAGRVMAAALRSGIEVTSLNHRYPDDNPRILFMRIAAKGAEDKLSLSLNRVFEEIEDTRDLKIDTAPIEPSKGTLSPSIISGALGHDGKMENGVYIFSAGRKASFKGETIEGEMGVSNHASFAGSDHLAFVTGEFVTCEDGLSNILKALLEGGINVTAIHNRLTTEVPRLIFVRFQGTGPALDLAKAVRDALDFQSGPYACPQ